MKPLPFSLPALLCPQLSAEGEGEDLPWPLQRPDRLLFSLPEEEEGKNINQVYLNGFICKPPIYRKTPFGREISDILVAVNRAYNKSDYIPCIAWGRNARYIANLEVGANIHI